MQTVEGVVTTLPGQLLQGITCSTQQALERMAEGTQHALGFLAEGLLVRIRRLEHLTLPPPAMPDVIVAHLACQGYLPQAGQLLCAGLRTGRLPTDVRLDLVRRVAGVLWRCGPPSWSTLLARVTGGAPPESDSESILDSYDTLYHGFPYEIYEEGNLDFIADPPQPRLYELRRPP